MNYYQKQANLYSEIFSRPQIFRNYGTENYGQRYLHLIAKENPSFILDIGCGNNQFCNDIAKKYNIPCMGVDIGHPFADVIAPSNNLPIPDKFSDITTCFHVLQCIKEDEIPNTIKEVKRVTKKKILFTVPEAKLTKQMVIKGNVYDIHHTLLTPEEWQELLSSYGLCYRVNELITLYL